MGEAHIQEGLIFGGKFVLVIREAYIRGGLIFGILRYLVIDVSSTLALSWGVVEKSQAPLPKADSM